MTLPAPVGGLNTRDGLTAMEPNEAVLLENWFPSSTSVDTRKGYAVQTGTSISGYVETLMAYSGETTSKLFAASSIGTIYDVTTADTLLVTEDDDFITTVRIRIRRGNLKTSGWRCAYREIRRERSV